MVFPLKYPSEIFNLDGAPFDTNNHVAHGWRSHWARWEWRRHAWSTALTWVEIMHRLFNIMILATLYPCTYPDSWKFGFDAVIMKQSFEISYRVRRLSNLMLITRDQSFNYEFCRGKNKISEGFVIPFILLEMAYREPWLQFLSWLQVLSNHPWCSDFIMASLGIAIQTDDQSCVL